MLRSILFMLGITTPVFLYLGWSLGTSFGWILITLLFFSVFSFPFVKQGFILNQISFLSMGYLSFLITFIVLKDLLRLAGFQIEPIWTYGAALVALIAGHFIASSGPKVVSLRIPVSNLSADLEGLRIIHLSDLHVGSTIRRKYVEGIVEKVNALSPDIVALTGDIGDGPVDKHKNDIGPLFHLKSKFGVFYVPGNHEYYWNANEWFKVMKEVRAIVLLNRGQKIQVKDTQILVAGVTDPVGSPKPDPAAGLQNSEDAIYKILLSHRPGIAEEASRLGYDLQLSGHTHGGQFFPWTIIVWFVHTYSLGHYLIDKMSLNVNAGTGSWGPFLRLGTTSEITQIELYCSVESLG